MNFIGRIKSFFRKVDGFLTDAMFNVKWKCGACGTENGNGKYFCDDCLKKLPFNDGNKCNHCGRKTAVPETYCLTCKNKLTSLYVCRSAFVYDYPINALIKNFKYKNARYLREVFAEYLYAEYVKENFSPDYLAIVPMTAKAYKKRGFNQSEFLADDLSSKCGVPVFKSIIKKFDTRRQVTLSAEDRLKNLVGAYKITDKASVIGKEVLIIDDVTTTGATGEAVAKTFLNAGAKKVGLLTVASLPDINSVKRDKNKRKK